MGCNLVFDPVSYLLFITVFEFAISFWVLLVNSFQEVRVETSLFREYILDDTLDKDTPNDDNGINGINDNENYNYDSNKNNDCNRHNDDDNDNNYDNDNGNQTIVIFQAMHF